MEHLRHLVIGRAELLPANSLHYPPALKISNKHRGTNSCQGSEQGRPKGGASSNRENK